MFGGYIGKSQSRRERKVVNEWHVPPCNPLWGTLCHEGGLHELHGLSTEYNLYHFEGNFYEQCYMLCGTDECCAGVHPKEWRRFGHRSVTVTPPIHTNVHRHAHPGKT